MNFFKHIYSYPIVRVFIDALAIGLVVLSFSYLLPKEYCSESKVLISLTDKTLDAYKVSEVSNRNALTLIELIKTKEFLREVLQKAGIQYSEEDLYDGYAKKISTFSTKDSGVLEIKVCFSQP